MNTANSLGAPLNSQVQVDQRLMFQEVHLFTGKSMSINDLGFERCTWKCTSQVANA